MRVLLLSAYEAVSHRYWANSLMAELTDVEWTLLSLPPRHFAWRIRGNPLSWWLKEHATLSQRFDVVLATSMVDMATLVGLFPHLGQARKIVYFHENQFAYPESSEQVPQVEAKMVNLYAALAADTLVFNTAYNRDSFFTGVRQFLKKMPENLPAAAPLERLRRSANVLPVPLQPLAQVRLAQHLVCWGPQPEEQYQALLNGGGIVVSTTWHEFQGLAIMEAAQRGAWPLVPDRLCFPELYPDAYRYDGTREGLYQRLAAWLQGTVAAPERLDTSPWEWPQWREAYRQLLD